MKNIRLAALLAAMLVLAAFSKHEPKNDLGLMKLKGRVKSIFESTKCMQPSRHCFEPKNEFYLNENGKLTREIFRLMPGRYTRNEYLYDNAGRLSEWRDCSNAGIIYMRKLYFYNNAGQLTEMRAYNDSTAVAQQNYKSDIYKYDSEDKNLETITYDMSGKYLGKKIYEREGDTVMRIRNINAAGKAIDTTFCKYDSRGNEIEKRYTPSKIKPFVTTYDEHSNFTRQGTISNDSIVWNRLYWEYKYDSIGNWVERKYYTAPDTLYQITTRAIEYY